MKNDLITFNGKELRRIFYRDEPVVTFPMIDQLHERPEDTAGRNFRENKERFLEGEDYFVAPYEEWNEILSDSEDILNRRNSSDQTSEENQEDSGTEENGSKRGGYRGSMYLFTRQGYLLLVKSLNDDRAWEVQRMLVKHYFVARELIAREGFRLSPEQTSALLETSDATRQEMAALREEFRAMGERVDKIDKYTDFIARKVMKIEEHVIQEFPIIKVVHPKGFVRIFLIYEKPMVLGMDFITIHKGMGNLANTGNILRYLGFQDGVELESLTSSQVGLMYGAFASDVMTKAGLTPRATHLLFITPTGMERVRQINPDFYAWYTEKGAAVYGTLLRIMHTIREREVHHG